MHKAHKFLNGGFVSGEVKLALTLRLLAGGSYLDICLIYQVGWSSAYDILHKVLENWICNDDVIQILNKDYLRDKKEMKKKQRTELDVTEANEQKQELCALSALNADMQLREIVRIFGTTKVVPKMRRHITKLKPGISSRQLNKLKQLIYPTQLHLYILS